MIIVKNKQHFEYKRKLNGIFDQFGNIIKRSYSDGSVTTYKYDKFGNEIKIIWYDGNQKVKKVLTFI